MHGRVYKLLEQLYPEVESAHVEVGEHHPHFEPVAALLDREHELQEDRAAHESASTDMEPTLCCAVASPSK